MPNFSLQILKKKKFKKKIYTHHFHRDILESKDYTHTHTQRRRKKKKKKSRKICN